MFSPPPMSACAKRRAPEGALPSSLCFRWTSSAPMRFYRCPRNEKQQIMTTPEQFQSLLEAPEGSHLEFKSATGKFHLEKLVDYCVAIANEGGGKVILGVSDRRPRKIVGTGAFAEPGPPGAGLHQRPGPR